MRRQLQSLPRRTPFNGGRSFTGVVLAQRPAEEKTVVWISEGSSPPRVAGYSDKIWVTVLPKAEVAVPAEVVERWK